MRLCVHILNTVYILSCVNAKPDGPECTSDSCAVKVKSLLQTQHTKAPTYAPGNTGDDSVGRGGGHGSGTTVECDWETQETCYDDNWIATSCDYISTGGCPCKEGEQKCGAMDDYAGWCSADPCPLQCDWETQDSCFDDNWIVTSCAPISDGGCPCKEGELKCGAMDGWAGWCHADPCPLQCDWETEDTCFDDNWTATSCEPISTGGCPCKEGEQKCGGTDYYAGWCQADECPLTCDWMIEETCFDDDWVAISCAPTSTGGCPCKEGEKKCGATDTYPGWCSTSCSSASLVEHGGKGKGKSRSDESFKGKAKGAVKAKMISEAKGKAKGKANLHVMDKLKGKAKGNSRALTKPGHQGKAKGHAKSKSTVHVKGKVKGKLAIHLKDA